MAICSRFGSPCSPRSPRYDSDALPPSNASAPSLRSRNSVYVPMARVNDAAGAGNVKVVVRVRDFLPRGKPDRRSALASSMSQYLILDRT